MSYGNQLDVNKWMLPKKAHLARQIAMDKVYDSHTASVTLHGIVDDSVLGWICPFYQVDKLTRYAKKN